MSFARSKRGHLVRGAAIVLGLAALSQGRAAASAASTATLIYAGWFGNTIPTPAFVAAHRTFLETQPFGGLAMYLRNDSTGVNATTSVMTPTPVSYSSIMAVLSPVAGVAFTNLKENYGLIQGSRPPDFFDDWTVTIQNFANAARALHDSGFRGIVFDNEQYFSPWGNYPTGVKYGTRSLADYQSQARLRGNQVMTAMAAEFPGIAVVTLHGPYVSEPKVPVPLIPNWSSANELLGPFFVGFMEGSAAATLNVDGGELYNLRTADEFQRAYTWRKYTLPSDAINCAFIPPADRPAYPGKTSIGFGVYDCPFGGADMNPTILRSTLANALRQADRVVWFYTEAATFLLPPSQGGASATWVDAVRLARSDAGDPAPAPSPAPGSPPVAPSNLQATAVSSTEVDLTWTDQSSDESSFEVERKTGSAGTWAKVLTTGANVSAINDINLTPATTYVYRVRAVNVSGASAYTSEVTVSTPSAPVTSNGPAAPTHFTTRSISATDVGLTWWDMSNNETSFEVERRLADSAAWVLVLTVGANISIATDTGLTESTSYVYRMRARNSAGVSAYTSELPVTTSAAPLAAGLAAPSHLTIRSTAVGRISVTWWDMSNNETRFEIERKTGTSGTWGRVGTVGANISIFDDLTVSQGVLYVYRARAGNSSGVSAWTNEISATAP